MINNINKIEEKCKKMKNEKNIGLIVIECLQLVTGIEKAFNIKEDRNQICKRLKRLSKKINIPIIVTSPLPSSVDRLRKDHRPILQDLRDIGVIIQHFDIIMLLYRDDYYNKESKKKNILEVNILKNKKGLTNTLKLKYVPQVNRYF